jgi:hypothetical protein
VCQKKTEKGEKGLGVFLQAFAIFSATRDSNVEPHVAHDS